MATSGRAEAHRLRALAEFGIMDTAAEAAFDDIARLASMLCATPSALVTFVDATRQWFKARVAYGIRFTPREVAFCDHTIRGPDVMIVEDAHRDPRFAANPYVLGDPHIRFYAGTPIVTADGHALGALAVVDYVPRTLTPSQRDGLALLGKQVLAQLELRRRVDTAADATARELRRTHERYELVMRATNDVVWDWDIVTGEIWWSDSFKHVYGDPREEVNTSYDAWLRRLHPEDRDRVAASLDAAVTTASGETWSNEYRFLRHDGTYARIFDRGYVMRDSAGRALRMIGAMMDLSERLRLEEQVIRSQKMEAIGQLAGGIAHDFNNILTIIECNAFMLARGVTRPDHVTSVKDIAEAAERAAGLTRQLLLVSRKQPARRTTTSLNDIVSQLTRMLQRVLGEHIELQSHLDLALPAVAVDIGMIEQVLLNLAVNARDAMPRGGRLAIATTRRTVAAALTVHGLPLEPGDYVTITVEDTGTGIAPDIVDKIFEPFFTTKDVGKGTGLGLSTVRGIVGQHRGAIDVVSHPGGTKFVVYLPAGDATATVPARDAVTVVPTGTETLLVVEDEPVLRHGVAMFLTRCGYTVLEAPSAVAALEVWATHRDAIQLVLTDLVMPAGLTGRELAARLQADVPTLPIIFTSGYPDEQAHTGEPLAEGENFLGKPYDPSRLAQLVRRRLDARRPTA